MQQRTSTFCPHQSPWHPSPAASSSLNGVGAVVGSSNISGKGAINSKNILFLDSIWKRFETNNMSGDNKKKKGHDDDDDNNDEDIGKDRCCFLELLKTHGLVYLLYEIIIEAKEHSDFVIESYSQFIFYFKNNVRCGIFILSSFGICNFEVFLIFAFFFKKRAVS